VNRFQLAALLPFAALHASAAAPAAPPVVLELFTSESCSSCPPADDLLAEYARTRPDVLPLAFHVDYWNALSWRDRFSFPGATERQRGYAAQLGAGVYTPQLVAAGRFQAVGSDRDAVEAAIRQAKHDQEASPALEIDVANGKVVVRVGQGTGRANVLLIGFDNLHSTSVRTGENGGRTITEANVVRSLANLGPWRGSTVSYTTPLPASDRAVALLQAPDGTILAARAINIVS
jgi:hypothetical protein